MASDSMRAWARQAPGWMNGIFYPLVVAVLLAVLVTLQGLREDMAVIKTKVHNIEKWVDRQEARADAGHTWRPAGGARPAAIGATWRGKGAAPE